MPAAVDFGEAFAKRGGPLWKLNGAVMPALRQIDYEQAAPRQSLIESIFRSDILAHRNIRGAKRLRRQCRSVRRPAFNNINYYGMELNRKSRSL